MNDRIEETAAAIGKALFPMTPFDEMSKGMRDGFLEAARTASGVLATQDEEMRRALLASERLRTYVYQHWASAGGSAECPHGIGRVFHCRACDEIIVQAALTRQDGPSQAVNYVSTSHEGNRMRCLSCDTEQYPNCKVCGAMLMNEVAPNDGRYSWAQIEGVLWRVHAPEPWHRAFPNAALETIHNALKPTPESTQEPSQQEAKPRAALCVGCLCIEGCSVNGLCPVHGDNAPAAPVQPSTDDVVEWMDWKYCQIRGVPAQDVDAHLRALTAALAVARAGWHSWESVEKAMRQQGCTLAGWEYMGPCFIEGVRDRLEAEPAERVTPRDIIREVLLNRKALLRNSIEINDNGYAGLLADEIAAELDAQGGNGK